MLCERLTWYFNLKPPIRVLDVISDVLNSRVTTGVSKGCSFGGVDGFECEAKCIKSELERMGR